jgi:hypothetical protein
VVGLHPGRKIRRAEDNEYVAYSEKELLERIRRLEEQNSALQDKLDMIWAVLAPDYDVEEDTDDADETGPPSLVQIDGLDGGRKPRA